MTTTTKKDTAKPGASGSGRLPSDIAPPSTTDAVRQQDDVADDPDRPTAREGLKPIGRERPHPTAAARTGKTSGEAGTGSLVTPDPETDERRKAPPSVKVEATQLGYYGDTRRRTGDVFLIYEEDFAPQWMRMADGSTPVRTTTTSEALRKENEEIKALKGRPGLHTGPDDRTDHVPAGEGNPLGAD